MDIVQTVRSLRKNKYELIVKGSDLMDLAFIDLMANQGDSVLHRNSAISKFFFVLSILASAIIANRPLEFLPMLVVLIISYLLAEISLIKVAHYAVYPAFFSLIFALIRFTVSISAGFTVILKAVTAALALLLFIFTTPYPELFGLMSKFLPQVLVDGMFFTYRIFFILIGTMENFLKSIRLKGGYRPLGLLSNIKNLVGAIGVIFMHAFDMSERMHQVLTIRGYTGQIKTELRMNFRLADYLMIILGIGLIILVVII